MSECWALALGASRGVGLALARGLAGRGCSIVLSSRRPSLLEEARRSLLGAGAPRVVVAPGDLRVESSLRGVLEEALRASGGRLRAAVISYGNPACEPSTIGEAPWSCWVEAARLYLASTSLVLRFLGERSRGRVTVAAVTSFTVWEPHPPLVVADAVRAGLPAILQAAARRWPGRVQTVLLVLGSFRTPGAEETVRLAHPGEELERAWRERVEGLSPLGRAGRLEELERVGAMLLDLPEYVSYTPLRVDGASGRCLC